jgi:hypothetical protein
MRRVLSSCALRCERCCRGEAFGERRTRNPVEHPDASPCVTPARICAATLGEAFENPVGLVGLHARMLRPYRWFAMFRCFQEVSASELQPLERWRDMGHKGHSSNCARLRRINCVVG